MRSPTVDAEWLRKLADLVEQGTVSVIKCELRDGAGVVLGVVKPRPPETKDEELPQG